MPADQIRGYEELVKGSAEKIIDATFLAPSRRQSDIVNAQISSSRVGQGWAIGLALICVIAAIVFFARGNTIAGCALLGMPLLLLIGSFLPWRRQD